MNYENENNFLETLIKRISKLPGLGPRSARRIIFYLLKNKELHLRPLIESLIQVEKNIKKCIKKCLLGELSYGTEIMEMCTFGAFRRQKCAFPKIESFEMGVPIILNFCNGPFLFHNIGPR